MPAKSLEMGIRKINFCILLFFMLVVSCECKDMHLRRLPEEKEVIFNGEAIQPQQAAYCKGQSRDIQLRLTSKDEEAKNANFKLLSWEVANGKIGTLDVHSLHLGDNALSYTPKEPGKHELMIKVAVEGEEENAQIFHYILEAPKADWKVAGSTDSEGSITLKIKDAPQEWHEKPWYIKSTRWSRGCRGSIVSANESLKHGPNTFPITLQEAALEEAPYICFHIQGPDGEEVSLTIDLKEACIAKL
jgi:hypothetical protein